MALTVAQLIAALQALPQDLEVLTPEAYDNDTEWTATSPPMVATVEHCEAHFFSEVDAAEVAANPDDFSNPRKVVLLS